MISAITTNLPVFIIIAPLFVAFVLPTWAQRKRLVENLVISVEILMLLGHVILLQLFCFKGIPIIYRMGGWSAP